MKNMTPPMLPFDAFLEMLDDLKDKGIPAVIKMHTFKNRSTHHSQQMAAACKFLGLANEYGGQTDKLYNIVFSENERDQILKEILTSSYQQLFEHHLETITQEGLTELFVKYYDLKADSLKKARTFFVKACQYAKIILSESIFSRLRGKKIEKGSGLFEETKSLDTAIEPNILSEKTKINMDEQPEPTKTSESEAKKEPDAYIYSINLKSGGTLALSAEVDLWKLDKSDRDFVFKIADDMKEYLKT